MQKKPQVLAYLWFHIYQVHNGVLKLEFEILKHRNNYIELI